MARSRRSTPGDFIIDDETLNVIKDDVFVPIVDGELKGHGLVPRDYRIYPPEMFDPPSQMPLIPRSEWSERLKEQERLKARLSDVRNAALNGQPFPALDQDGQGFCATADTEVLTEKGWVAYPDYDWQAPLATVNPLTHALEFQSPFQRHVYEYDGPVIYSTNRRIDFGVTPDHQMYVRKWDERRRALSDRYSFVRAADLGWYAGLLPAPSGQIGTELVELEVPGDRRYDGDDFLALLGLIISDGYAGGAEGPRPGKGTMNLVSFALFREGTRPDIAALAARIGFKEAPSRPGVWNRWNAGALAAWVRANCYTGDGLRSQNKRVPDIVKVASVRQIKHFLRYFDDRNRDGSQFYSTSKRLIDDLQELHLRIGKRSSIGKSKAKDIPFTGNAKGVIRSGGGYVLTVGAVDTLCLDRKKHIETDRYKGLVYCAAVPNHTLLTRRNGSVLISSNCWAYSTTGCVMILRAINNMPHVRLSGHAIGCKVKNFRDEGGWCGLSAKFHREQGCPSIEFWAEKSMSRSNDKPETWTNAAKHKVTEEWVDLSRDVYDQNLTFDQVATCLLSGIPCAVDFNWWSHSVCALDLVEVESGSFGLRILNSWTDSWGENGTGVLRGGKERPDGAVALRVTGGSST